MPCRLAPVAQGSLLFAVLIAATQLSCGYHVAGKADTLPETIKTIAIPPFQNATTEYKIEQFLTQAVVREFISRTRYQVVSKPENADAVLQATVVGFFAFPANFDPETNRASSVSTTTQVRVTLLDRSTALPLYENPNLTHRELYEVSIDPEAYFEERQAALVRSSQSMARRLVSAVLEGF